MHLPGASSDSLVEENTQDIFFTTGKPKEIDAVLKYIKIKGARVPAAFDKFVDV